VSNHMMDVREAMMDGIMRFYNDVYREMQNNSYTRIKKMLSLVKEFDKYHNNTDNIVYLMSMYNDLDYGFMKNIFEFMKN